MFGCFLDKEAIDKGKILCYNENTYYYTKGSILFYENETAFGTSPCGSYDFLCDILQWRSHRNNVGNHNGDRDHRNHNGYNR